MKVPCQRCGQPVEIAVDPPQIVNTPAISMVVVNHPKAGFCITCGTKVALYLQAAQMAWMACEMPAQQKSPIVLVPAGALPKGQQ